MKKPKNEDLEIVKTAEKFKKEYRELDCLITEQERKDTTQKLCEKIEEKNKVNEERKEIMAGFKLRLTELDNIIQNSSRAVLTGYEKREVECNTYLNKPEDGKKTIVRTDTGEETIEDMTPEELQEEIEFNSN
jgi:hypothetical protein